MIDKSLTLIVSMHGHCSATTTLVRIRSKRVKKKRREREREKDKKRQIKKIKKDDEMSGNFRASMFILTPFTFTFIRLSVCLSFSLSLSLSLSFSLPFLQNVLSFFLYIFNPSHYYHKQSYTTQRSNTILPTIFDVGDDDDNVFPLEYISCFLSRFRSNQTINLYYMLYIHSFFSSITTSLSRYISI